MYVIMYKLELCTQRGKSHKILIHVDLFFHCIVKYSLVQELTKDGKERGDPLVSCEYSRQMAVMHGGYTF